MALKLLIANKFRVVNWQTGYWSLKKEVFATMYKIIIIILSQTFYLKGLLNW